MSDEEKQLKKRFSELRDKSYSQSTFYFTDFLTPAELDVLLQVCPASDVTLWGGAEDCERVVARFGNSAELGYEIPFPVSVVKIEPLMEKFSDDLSHRDFLGALINLGIERKVMGDIIVMKNSAFVFVLDRISDFIAKELTRVKHTSVKCSVLSDVQLDLRPGYEEIEIIVSSLRLDGIISKLYKLSRTRAKELFTEGKIYVNSRLCINPSITAFEDNTVSVRGYGKFVLGSTGRTTKKGNIVVTVKKRV